MIIVCLEISFYIGASSFYTLPDTAFLRILKTNRIHCLLIIFLFLSWKNLFVSIWALMAVRKTFNAILMRGYFSTNFLLLYIMCKLLEPPHTLFFLLSMHNNVSFNIFAQNKQVIRRRSDNPYDVRIFNGNNIFRYMESMEMSLHFLFCGSLNLR